MEWLRSEVIEVIATALVIGAAFVFRRSRRLIKAGWDWITGHKQAAGQLALEFNEIQRMLVETMTICGADRIYVVQYHNGSTFDSDKPMWKLSCTNEVCKEGVSYEVSKIQNIPVTLVWECISPFYGVNIDGVNKTPPVHCKDKCPEPKGVFWFDVLTMRESQLVAILKSRGAVGVAISPLVNGKNIIGYIGLDYTKLPVVSDICSLCQAASRISLILSK